jgi:hypothetical protein
MALNYQNYASLGVNLNRQLSGPLDISTVFNSQVDLTYYLTGGTGDKTGVSEYWTSLPATYPYAGQIVALATDAGVSVLVIKESESGFITEPISAETAVDGEVITYNADKELTLVGFADAATGARLQKTATGVEWVVPGSDGTMTDAQVQQAIKDLNRDVTNLGKDLDAVEKIVGKESTGEGVASTGLIARVEALEAQDGVLAGEIDALETSLSNVYTKKDTNNAIAAAIAAVDHLSREIVETLPENANENVIYMVLREDGTGQDVYNEYMYINGAWEIIGDTSVDLTGYAKKEDILVKSVSPDFTVTEAGQLTLKADAAPEIDGSKISNIAISNVTGLEAALNSKVAAEEGKSLVSNTLITKLGNLAEIKSVSNEFALTDGELSVKAIAADKITGLPAALTEIEDLKGAQSSYVKSVAINGTALTLSAEQGVNIPVATDSVLGVVKSASGDNKVAVAADGTMSVASVNITSLSQNEGEWLEINGGGADLNAWN